MDDLERKQFQGKPLETFRDPKTGRIRVVGANFNVAIEECGAVTVRYDDATVRVGPGAEAVVERKPAKN